MSAVSARFVCTTERFKRKKKKRKKKSFRSQPISVRASGAVDVEGNVSGKVSVAFFLPGLLVEHALLWHHHGSDP